MECFLVTTKSDVFNHEFTLAIPPLMIVEGPGQTQERWGIQDPRIWQVFDEPPVEGAVEAALSYGFRRVFYENTHHYFVNFKMAWFYGVGLSRQYNNRRESRQLGDREGRRYYEAVSDVHIFEIAQKHVRQIKAYAFIGGIEILPQLLRKDACGDSIEEIYAGWPNLAAVESWLGPDTGK